MADFDRTKTLEELESEDWGEPNFGSHVVTECHRLRRVALCEFTAENLRIMIGQQIGLEYLIPLALERLREDPFAEGDFYRGDLLENVLRADSRFLVGHPDYRRGIAEIVSRAFSSLESLEKFERQTTEKALREAYDIFERMDYFAKYGRC
jgi:contact-dependent growth inhibition (CDI) system CdiI-like immunity protein